MLCVIEKELLISGYCYQKGCYHPNFYTLRAHKTNPCTEIHLLSSELPSNGSDLFAFLEHIEMDV